MTGTGKGGYQAHSRLESAIDEIAMEVKATLAEPPSPEAWRKAFEEIGRLARDARGLVAYLNGKQPPLRAAGAA